ncbi:MFS sugar transporter-like protein [Rhexocercosporidium sp. MPI-PUGE-AT-0058]|nr:MFS sugar transporter-like protein [Rhexocercosporidium sp. MPI-PUGE-AT-0058]
MPQWTSSVVRSQRSPFSRPSNPVWRENSTSGDQSHLETPLLGGATTSPVIRGNLKNVEDIITRFICPRVSGSSTVVSVLLVLCSCITSTTLGYDASMMNGLNMLPSYTDYFHLNTATMSLATSSLWIGGAVAGLTYGQVTDVIGRRNALVWAALMTFISVIIQSRAKNTAMFVIGRILVGYGTSASTLTGPTYLAETLPYQWRACGVGLLNDCYYVGGLIAAGITYKTATIDSTWAWRIPSVVQGFFSILCIIILPFIPESPRWLANVGRREEALTVIAQTYANGDESNPVVLAQYQQIIDTIHYERETGETLSLNQLVKTPVARKRVILAISVAVFSTISGNVIASYYLRTMLNHARIFQTSSQLQINMALNGFCLCCALAGTYYSDQIGRKITAIVSTSLLTVLIFIVGVLRKEVLNYPIRANGMGIFTFVLNGASFLCVFSFPFALEAIKYKAYMINGLWDVLEIVFIWFYWVETSGKTLEIDAVMDGSKQSGAPNLGDTEREN